MSKNLLRSRNWSVVTYCLPNEFEMLLNACVHYAYIYHDNDNAEPHYHILCVFKNARSENGLRSLIVGNGNSFFEVVKSSLSQCFDYLTHKNNSDKFQYSLDSVITDDLTFWNSCSTSDDNVTDSLLNDILNGLPLRELAHRYGRDFMKNWRSYCDFARCVAYQERGSKFSYERIIEDIDFTECFQMRSNGQLEIISPKKVD